MSSGTTRESFCRDGAHSARKVCAVFGAGLLGVVLLAMPANAGARHPHSSHRTTQGASRSNPDGGGVDKPYPAAGQAAHSQGSSDWDGNNGCGNDDDREDDNNGNCGRKHERAKAHEGEGAVKASELAKAHDRDDVVKASELAKAANAATLATPAPASAPVVTPAVAVADTSIEIESAAAPVAVPASVLGLEVARADTSGLGTGLETAAAAAPATASPAIAGIAALGSTRLPVTAARGTEVLGVQVSRGAALARTGMSLAVLGLIAVGLLSLGFALRRTRA